jgi:adenosylcobyric acid synthase
MDMRGALMVCGTASDVGKSQIVAGLCRLLARQGVRVAPFKAQNMALNSFVTPDGHEIGRAQAMQAMAAGVEPDVAMNPILLKPTSDRSSQVVVLGRPWKTLDAVAYHAAKPELMGVVTDALADLRSRYDVILCEGAGSPAEINLLEGDLVNLGLASKVGIPAIVVGDIDRGGVFAALYGTVALLPDELRRWVRGFVINKFRGDPALLGDALADLERRTGRPTLGVLPFAEGLTLDAEDSLALSLTQGARRGTGSGPSAESTERDPLDIVVIRFPHISNFTDVDALAVEPGASVRFVDSPDSLGQPDLVVLPGSKTTADDLAWMRSRGFEEALSELRGDGPGGIRADSPMILGICGGYQMLGELIEDPGSIESRTGVVSGLGLLDLRTVYLVDKRTRQRRGRTTWRQSSLLRPYPSSPGRVPGATGAGTSFQPDWELEGSPRQTPSIAISGYEIHHGRTHAGPSAVPWFLMGDGRGQRTEGIIDDRNGVCGSSLHGLFEGDEFRATLLGAVAERRGKRWAPSGVSFALARQGQIDQLANLCQDHLDLDALWLLITEGGGTRGDESAGADRPTTAASS